MSSLRLKTIIAVSLTLATLIVFWRVGGYDFINYDDGSYVFDNSHVKKGWSLDSLKWAFTTTFHLHWHPLTWLSLMTDVQFFGVNAGAHHLVNLFIHILNTLLLFYVLTRMTGAVYRSAFVAALFALHPLHVEPVAWIADRKDLLSAFFWMTTLWVYLRYVSKPDWRNAAWVFVSFMCSLMSKSMAVTLPLILLVLDYWPLRRFVVQKPEIEFEPKQPAKPIPGKKKGKKQKEAAIIKAPPPKAGSNWLGHPAVRLMLEKALLFLPMIIGAGVTLMAIQGKKTSSVGLSKVIPSLQNLSGAVVSYAHYLYQMVWPVKLAIPYPPLKMPPLWEIGLAIVVLSSISALAYWRRRQNPYLMAGWLWYLISLLPAIGLVQNGPHIQADRYTYVPLIGVFIMIAWGAADLLAKSRQRKWILGIGAGLALTACMSVSWAQIGHWKNSITIFSYSVKVTDNNALAHNNLGSELLGKGRVDEAMPHFFKAIQINPKHDNAHCNLGLSYNKKGDLEKAIVHFDKALAINPGYVKAHFNLGNVYLRQRKYDQCIKHFKRTTELDFGHYKAYNNLGLAYSRMGKTDRAIAQFSRAVKINTRYYVAYNSLAAEYMKQGDLNNAVLNYNKTLEIKPDYDKAHYNLGLVLLKQKQFDEAILHFSRAIEINPKYRRARESLEFARKKETEQ